MRLTYDELLEDGFSSQQINQILLLEKYYDDEFLQKIDVDIDVKNIRILNQILKQKEDDLTDGEKEFLLDLVLQDIDPNLYVNLKTGRLRSYFTDIVTRRNLFDDHYVNFCQIMDYIKKNPDSLTFIMKFSFDCIDLKINPLDLLKDGFQENDAYFALKLYSAGLTELIPKINNEFTRSYNNMKHLKTMIENKMDYVDLINNYSDNQIKFIMDELKDGYDLYSILKGKSYINKMALCSKLMHAEVEEDEIDIILTKFEYTNTSICMDKWNRLIELEKEGYEVHKFFETLPTRNEMDLLEQLVDIGYEDIDVQYYINEIGEKLKNVRYSLRLSVGDVEKYIELLDEGYDITNLIKQGYEYEDLNVLIKLATIKDMDLQELIDKEFEAFEFRLFKNCLKYGREDVFEAVIHCQYPDEDAYDYIIDIFKADEEKGTFHDIVNLLFDKGNDAFFDYDESYEFNCYQKMELTSLVCNLELTDEQINLIRDNNIDSECMNILGNMLSRGYNITHVMEKIEELDEDNLRDIYSCMKMGFALVPQEKAIER